jgi:uncharacterized membrane protein YecN with MAPEG domain
MTTARSTFWHLWRWPIVLGILTATGLISALFSDGGSGDVLAWIALGVPIVVALWYSFRSS